MATITGTSGNDSLIGTAGNDMIDGAGGIDTIKAGAGDDIVRLAGGLPYRNLNYAEIDGGAGYDVLDLTGWDHQLKLSTWTDGITTITEDYGWVSVQDYAYTAVAHASGFEEIRIGPNGGDVALYSGSVGDPSSLRGWKVVAGSATDYVADARGNDTILAGGGDDYVTFNGGSDKVSLADGNDTYHIKQITGYAEHATIDAGAGTDLLLWDDVALPEGLTVDLAAGTAHASLADFALTGFENVKLNGNFVWTPDYWQVSLAGDDAANSLTSIVLPHRSIVVSGRGGDDHILLESGWLSPSAKDASPTLYGGAGNDEITGGVSNDWINGGGGAPGDTLSPAIVNDGADTLRGLDGNDHIYGNAQFAVQGAADGGDLIFGDFGMDYVNGNAGNDTIRGGEGPDRLYGGAGDDVIDGDDWDGSWGSSGNGNDHINGNKGNDSLHGGGGNDQILGGQGNDLIEGGVGLDTVSGNAGNDLFQFGGWTPHGEAAAFSISGPDAGRTDVITDFQDGQDLLQLVFTVSSVFHPGSASDFIGALALAHTVLSVPPGTNWTEQVAAVQVGADTYLFWDGGAGNPASAVRLLNVDAATIGLDDFGYANWRTAL